VSSQISHSSENWLLWKLSLSKELTNTENYCDHVPCSNVKDARKNSFPVPQGTRVNRVCMSALSGLKTASDVVTSADDMQTDVAGWTASIRRGVRRGEESSYLHEVRLAWPSHWCTELAHLWGTCAGFFRRCAFHSPIFVSALLANDNLSEWCLYSCFNAQFTNQNNICHRERQVCLQRRDSKWKIAPTIPGFIVALTKRGPLFKFTGGANALSKGEKRKIEMEPSQISHLCKGCQQIMLLIRSKWTISGLGWNCKKSRQSENEKQRNEMTDKPTEKIACRQSNAQKTHETLPERVCACPVFTSFCVSGPICVTAHKLAVCPLCNWSICSWTIRVHLGFKHWNSTWFLI